MRTDGAEAWILESGFGSSLKMHCTNKKKTKMPNVETVNTTLNPFLLVILRTENQDNCILAMVYFQHLY